MFKNNLVVCVKNNNKILREENQKVFLPFNSTYSILLKNLHPKERCFVKIKIDGSDVLGGKDLVINANSSTELKRFLGENDSIGNSFKFIERTSDIEEFRGVSEMDGIIEVSFSFEVPYSTYRTPIRIPQDYPDWCSGNIYDPDIFYTQGTFKSINSTNYSGSVMRSTSANYSANTGVTAPGELVEQEFQTTSLNGILKNSDKIVLNLVGSVEKPVTIKTLKKCKMCGKESRPNAKFCSNCGASVQYV
jgi:hypothetical protein